MRLSVSNIAWDAAEDPQIADLLQRFGVDAIDVAPSKYFPQPSQASDQDIARVKDWWAQRGIDIIGMQALLFGTEGLNMFAPPPVQQAMLSHLSDVCRIAAGLGASRLVFGSPRNRDRSGLSDEAAMAVAVPFFRRLGDIAARHGVCICLEPNPRCYGANFMTGTADTLEVVAHVSHAAIGMQFDSGALTIDAEDPMTMLAAAAPYIRHIHASEPDLVTLGDGGADHGAMAAAIRQHLDRHPVTIEMVASKTEPHALAIARALGVADRHYRQSGGALA